MLLRSDGRAAASGIAPFALTLCAAGAAARGAGSPDAAGAERPRAAVRRPQVRAPGLCVQCYAHAFGGMALAAMVLPFLPFI